MAWWVRLYFDHTDFVMGSPLRLGWPDGGPTSEQPALLVEMFSVIESGIMKQMEIDRDNG